MKNVNTLHQNLHHWYAQHGRKDLPWRNTDDPYRIYLSEVMLQQTQVKTVLERFYDPFLARFPTLTALAKADLEEVIKAWEGLGYYNRARYLYQTAQITSPTLPKTVDDLQKLPGIGKNTAHAIAAFAYRRAVPVMEANLKRVLSRFFTAKTPTEKELWEYAHRLLDTKNPFDYNQAMMDIGALVCTTKNPQCISCPLGASCKGKSDPEHYPVKKSGKQKPIRLRNIIIWQNDAKALYLLRREGRFLHGMYGFDERDRLTHTPDSGAKKLGHITHHYSHFTLDANVYTLTAHNHNLPQGGTWHNMEEINTLPLSGADKKALDLL